MITEARLGDLLAAIGNHEAKALFFLAMEDEVPYGVTSSHRRFLEMQGSPPAFVGQVSTAQKYLLYSFYPIGLVVRQRTESGLLRHVRDDPNGTATALAGFLLSATLEQEISLQRLFGKTAAGGPTGAPERSPIRRFRILRALAATTGDTYTTAIAQQAGVREMPTFNALTVYATHGLLSYESSATYEMKTTYRVAQPIPPQVGRGNYRTASEITDYLNKLLADSSDELIVPREQIEDHIRAIPRWSEVANLRDVIQGILKRFVARGYVEPVTSHYGLTHARISMTPEQRAFTQQIVTGIEAIASGSPAALAEGKREARRIVNDPEVVRSLIRRAFRDSKLANNPVSGGERVRLASEAVAKHPGSTTDELMAVVDSTFSVQLLRAALRTLAKSGAITGEKQPDGPYRRWYPADPDSAGAS